VKKTNGYTHLIPIIKWSVRAMLPFAELFLIGWIIYFVFNSEGIGKGMTNILSACVGGLLVNYTKMSGFIFSRESDEIEERSK
tara:strand:- start:164 stop:412 length:249 start_codon:yes stop_codon:yes gene_type:complete